MNAGDFSDPGRVTYRGQVPFTSASSRLRSRLFLGSLAAVAALGLTACTGSSGSSGGTGSVGTGTIAGTASAGSSGSSGSASPSTSASKPSAPPAKPVHIKLLNVDTSTYGVGRPIIAWFSQKITSAKALSAATVATVNGKVVHGAWYFETSSAGHGPIEGHYRLSTYWPAHSKILVKINAKGVSAGRGLAFDDSLFSSWNTGARTISVVNDANHQMTVTSDGHVKGTYRVSLGALKTRTKRGTKVIMEKRPSICMTDTEHSYYECGIKFDQRLTYSGEYLHSAPWNHSLGFANLSNGCTNLSPSDAENAYKLMRVGDVVQYPNANGPAMQLGDGYGDWNVSWSEWQTGGLVSTTA
jgi:lipoprotein-anchoring transpeptidase ErfK/SrfK